MKARISLAKYCLLTALLLLLSACSGEHGFLSPAGPIAQAQRNHFLSIIAWMMVVIVPLFVAVPIVLWKYRLGGSSSTYRPNWASSWIFEVLIWGIPLIVVSALSWNLWMQSHALDPYRPIKSDNPTLNVQVVSLDWKWLFIYPDQRVAAVNELVLPVDRPVRFRLTSETVMQSFMIPRLGSQIYTMPGMVTELNLLADRTGTFRGQNTQYNGEGFPKQKFDAKVMDAQDFDDWIAQTRRSSPPLDMSAYEQLAKRSVLPSPLLFGAVPDRLFERVVSSTKGETELTLGSAAPTSTQGE
ncbi:COX aromatic rich motif-containing protein [Halomonas sp. PR-M31]|uniref:COX aromatic rich motif-containing protein n=1 Tax=Halomonas sp. PR-M31 TaxID=1471202 RepID=UPI000650EA22|nr:COX aromatic rich motif-containing protein [Halomonas sp. PR-M31]